MLNIPTKFIAFVRTLVFRPVHFYVSTSVNYFEIFYSVIKRFMVYMMYMLASFKLSAQVLFHHISVFKLILPVANSNAHILTESRFTAFPIRVVSTRGFTFSPSARAVTGFPFKYKSINTGSRAKLFSPTLIVFLAVFTISFIESHISIIYRFISRVKPLKTIGA